MILVYNFFLQYLQLKIFYSIELKNHNNWINEYYGITQHPITQNFTKYCELDLTHYITKDFLILLGKIS
jgi:hypothetical protein